MGSETIKLLPTINFSQLELERKSPNWESVKSQVKLALQEFGCFEATFDQIPRDLPDTVIQGLRQLFELPLQTKLQNMSNKHYRGYIGQHAVVPLYESLGIDDALDLGSIERFTNLMWSEGNPDFSTSMRSFTEKLSEFDQIVRKLVLESLGLEKYIDEHIESTNYLVRVQKYEAPKNDETELGLTAHTDKNMMTILYQNEVNGLELQTKDGHWITVEPSPNSLIVIIGDAFHAWTNGRLRSAYHRVMMKGSVDRYSVGLFSIPKEGYIIKAPEEMIDEEHPLLYKPYDHFEFVKFFYTDQGGLTALKAYCGVV
ncbi:hypothetical protein F511_37017 [Dorcoceras hygrometricum]|uniref:Fe2OG dioxygenase domain-containing protein n=1 Tax=Dorcoceras hygrometricum TaxID=472368 RepID=A0A2Z7B9D7_9LAMI|nr:hypothetical protein F511_37017 [Dorcoceras hygrometricum]